MNVVAVIQHTSGEYLGLMEDHLEGRRIRFQYFRPFAGGRKLPAEDLPADALVLLGGGPWGSAGTRDLPTLEEEVALTRNRGWTKVPRSSVSGSVRRSWPSRRAVAASRASSYSRLTKRASDSATML